MVRLLPSTRTQREEETAEATTRVLDLRTAALGFGALAGGYLVGRRLLGGDTPSTGDIRERAGDALPGDGVDVPIGGDGESDEGEEAEDEGEVAPSADPSLEEIDERTESDVKEEPAEPGEMQVDEELVEEAVDTDEESEE